MKAQADPVTGMDGAVEWAGRRLAARHTRRGFLDRMAKLALLVAGGPTLATFLAERAEARVCGQSGVTGKCPTFDCDGPGDVWGWCWYASPGCCANGGLKKICDCCTEAYPNVHGYCPSGTNVRCIVESCAEDPRVMSSRLERSTALTAAGLALDLSRRLPALRGGAAVVGDSEDPLAAAVAAPVAAALDAPLLLTGRAGLDGAVATELTRLGATEVVVVGPDLPPKVDNDVRALGPTVSRPHGAGGLGPVSVEVARFLQQKTGTTRAFCVETTGVSALAAPAAGAAAAARRAPLLIGVDAAIAAAGGENGIAVTYLVGPEAAGAAGRIPGSFPLRTGDRAGLARQLGAVAVATERLQGLSLHLVPEGSAGLASGTGAGVVLYHDDAVLGPDNATWVRDHRRGLSRAFDIGAIGGLGAEATHELQSSLNGFDNHLLQGVSGQGLPVRTQPLEERPLGLVRVTGAPPPPDAQSYWSGRANPRR